MIDCVDHGDFDCMSYWPQLYIANKTTCFDGAHGNSCWPRWTRGAGCVWFALVPLPVDAHRDAMDVDTLLGFMRCERIDFIKTDMQSIDILLASYDRLPDTVKYRLRIDLKIPPGVMTITALQDWRSKLLREKTKQSCRADEDTCGLHSTTVALREYGVEHFYYITHLDNLLSIITEGILSYNQIKQRHLCSNDISNPDVQIRRDISDLKRHGRCLHDYVPLYLNARNPMLYALKDRGSSIVVLRIDASIVAECAFMFTDGNAACYATTFYTSIDQLDRIPWDVLKADYWTDFIDGKRERCAEFLIFPSVPSTYIHSVMCRNDVAGKIQQMGLKPENADHVFF